jgi:hypothetical protein
MPAASGPANTTLTTLASVTARNGLLRLQQQRRRFMETCSSQSTWLAVLLYVGSSAAVRVALLAVQGLHFDPNHHLFC